MSNEETPETPMNETTRATRRKLLIGAGLGGVALAGGMLARPGAALATTMTESATDIFTVARTAEQLAVTFYANGIKNAGRLGISGANLTYLQAALAEEQIHENFLRDNGGKTLTSTFSFPHGDETFENQVLFIQTLEQLEVAFIAAYLAAVSEFAAMGQPRLAQIAAQIMGVEAEHRALGRDIGNLVPADNFGFEPVLLSKVGDAVSVLSNEGFLSPKEGNSYEYHLMSSFYPGVIYTRP